MRFDSLYGINYTATGQELRKWYDGPPRPSALAGDRRPRRAIIQNLRFQPVWVYLLSVQIGVLEHLREFGFAFCSGNPDSVDIFARSQVVRYKLSAAYKLMEWNPPLSCWLLRSGVWAEARSKSRGIVCASSHAPAIGGRNKW